MRNSNAQDVPVQWLSYPHAHSSHYPSNLLDLNPQREGTTLNSQSAVDKDTEVQIAAITESFSKQKEQVLKKLLDRVTLINPELHRNLRKREE